jgi:hypothetical protein
MEVHEAEPSRERRLSEQRRKPIRAGAVMDQHDVFTGAMHVVFDLDPRERHSTHR